MSRFRLLTRGLALPAVLLLLWGGAAWADDAPPAFSFSMTGSLGTETISGTNFEALGLLPDFGYGPLGIGIDLTFHFRFYEQPGGDFGIYPRAEDWWDSSLSFSQNLDKYVSRIAYVRWGHKGDPLYIQAGLLPATVLGTGFLVGGYSNGALRPVLKYVGVEVDASGELIGLPYGGFESFVGNITAFDVLGARAYVKPFAITNPDDAFLKQIQFGLTVAADTNPYAQAVGTVHGSGSVVTGGLDTMVPLYSSDLFSAVATGDAAVQSSHLGGAIGVGGKAVGFLKWGLQNRFLGDNFLPDYFDRGYEINRVSKYTIYSSSSVLVPGTVGWLATLGTSFLGDTVSIGVELSGPWTSQSQLYAQTKLQSWATLKAGVLPVSFDAFYVKNGLTSWDALASAENALVGAKVGYTVNAVTINVVYDLRYTNAGESGSNGHTWVSSSRVETAVKF
jgi:hypothetical protein